MLDYTRYKSVLVDILKSAEITLLADLHTGFLIRFVTKQPPWLIQCPHLHIAVLVTTFLAVFVEKGAEAGAARSRIGFFIGTVARVCHFVGFVVTVGGQGC